MRIWIGSCTRAKGLTLLEALVVMALVGVMVSLAAPAMSALRLQHRLQAEAEGLWSSLVFARSEALKRQQRVTLCAKGQGSTACDDTGDWQQGWLVFVDTNGNGRFDVHEALMQEHAAVPTPLRLAVRGTDGAYFSYNAEGRSATPEGAFMAGTWRFCRPGADSGWQVVSNALGRPRLEKVALSVCE